MRSIITFEHKPLFMGIEIERKFLVNKPKWEKLSKPEGQYYKQGYIVSDPKKSVRIRIAGTKSTITIKGATKGASREEFEYDIPRNDAEILLNNYTTSSLEKIRYKIQFKNKLWEVDEFKGENTGLILAEIELKEESETFDIPDWIEEEVTGNQRYYNVNLAQKH